MNARASTAVRAMPGTLGACGGGVLRSRRSGSRSSSSGHRRAISRRTSTAPSWSRTACSSGTPSGTPATTRSRAYSLLYYFPAALFGNDVVAVVSVVASSALFASLARREWGEAARWPSLAFALVACGSLFTGTYPYAAGLAAALGTLKALQLGRAWLAVALAALTLGLSPLAFLFLVVASLAVFLGLGMPRGRSSVIFGAGLVVVGLFQGALLLVYPQDSEYPFFRLSELLAVVGLSAACAALALRGGRRGRTLAFFFGLWALATAVAFLVSSPIGENVTRVRGIVLPLALLCAALASYRPRWLAALAVSGALAFTLVPYVRRRAPSRATRARRSATFWEPALRFLDERWTPDYRVEVVPTGDHWEAYWVPRAGFPLARGWYRQIDIAQNEVLYEEPLEPDAYRAWLALARHPLRPPARHPARARRRGA